MIRDALVHCRKVTAERQGDNVTHSAPAADGGEHSSAPVAAHRRRLRLGPGGEMGSQQQQRRALVAKIEGLAAAAAKARRGFAAPFPALASAAQRDRPGRNGGPAPPTTPPPAPALRSRGPRA